MEQQTTKGIKLGTVTRANEDMKGGSGKEINGVRYYKFSEAIETAKQQGLTLPTKQDFLDSGFTEERSKENKKLADKLGFTLGGYCGSDGKLNTTGRYGYRWSASPEDDTGARYFGFDGDGGELSRGYRYGTLPVRCLYKNIEERKYIPGLENYQASTLGNIKSINYNHTGKEKILGTCVRGGYLSVRLTKDGKAKHYLINRLMGATFLGLKLEDIKTVVMHLNNIKTDNRLENLKLGTQSDNEKQAYKDGKTKSNQYGKNYNLRPVLKNSTSDISSIGQFSTKELWDELGKRLLSK